MLKSFDYIELGNGYWLHFISSCSLYHYVTNSFDVFFAIIWWEGCFVSTGVGVIMLPSSTKPDSGITSRAVIFLVTNDTYSCSGLIAVVTHSIETFLVTVALQWALRTNQRLPRFTPQWGGAVLPVSDQWVQRVGLLVDDNEVHLLTDLHSKTDLGEGCVPIGR